MARLIDADALKETLSDLECEANNADFQSGMDFVMRDFMPKVIDAQPTAEPKRGRWIEIEHYRVHGEEYCDFECSICCHRISRVRGYYPNYCEECGSMNGGAENG